MTAKKFPVIKKNPAGPAPSRSRQPKNGPSLDDGEGDGPSLDDGEGDSPSLDDGEGDSPSLDDGEGDGGIVLRECSEGFCEAKLPSVFQCSLYSA